MAVGRGLNVGYQRAFLLSIGSADVPQEREEASGGHVPSPSPTASPEGIVWEQHGLPALGSRSPKKLVKSGKVDGCKMREATFAKDPRKREGAD